VRGFSLPELVGVLTVLAVMAAIAIPAVRLVGDTRAAEVGVRLEDLLRQARAASVGRGIPCGVRFNISSRSATLLALEQGQVVAMRDALGAPASASPIGVGALVAVQQVTGGSQSGNSAEIWFDETGSHIAVASNGTVSALTTDATITMTNGSQIVVRGTTGLIE